MLLLGLLQSLDVGHKLLVRVHTLDLVRSWGCRLQVDRLISGRLKLLNSDQGRSLRPLFEHSARVDILFFLRPVDSLPDWTFRDDLPFGVLHHPGPNGPLILWNWGIKGLILILRGLPANAHADDLTDDVLVFGLLGVGVLVTVVHLGWLRNNWLGFKELYVVGFFEIVGEGVESWVLL